MLSGKKKIIAVMLAASSALSILCSCDQIPSQSIEPSLPTTEAPETSMTAFETSKETVMETTAETTADNETYETAGDNTQIDSDFVRTVPGVSPEMMAADYWIGEDDNKILMNADQIKAFNHANRVHEKANDGTQMPFFDEFGDTFDGKVLKVFLTDNANSAPKDPSRYYLNGKPTTRSYWNDLIALSNIDGIPDEIEVRYGFTVKRMTLRLYPTEDRVFEGTEDKFFDFNLYSECMPYMPVYVLHESTDKEYLYVVPDVENVARRTSGDRAILPYMMTAKAFKQWQKDIVPQINDLASNGGMRTVHVFNEIFKPSGSNYWRVDYELKTWNNPNDMDEVPEKTRGTMYVRISNEDAIGQLKQPFADVRDLLIKGVDPAFAFRFTVSDVMFDKE